MSKTVAEESNTATKTYLDKRIAALRDEFADVFGEPGTPVHRELDHRIDLVDENAKPPR